ncbi:hypothetical protein [Paraburkholderia dilworthii]|uniref:hypothetical protein n=1 Tax=Paraburkholderia dilworthii TaxID=948106 RepID=UPI0012B5E38E|nr:hypothetical protein [Paraburkholderia dilworthii]
MSHSEVIYRSQVGEQRFSGAAEAGDSLFAQCRGLRAPAAQWLAKHARAFRVSGEA